MPDESGNMRHRRRLSRHPNMIDRSGTQSSSKAAQQYRGGTGREPGEGKQTPKDTLKGRTAALRAATQEQVDADRAKADAKKAKKANKKVKANNGNGNKNKGQNNRKKTNAKDKDGCCSSGDGI